MAERVVDLRERCALPRAPGGVVSGSTEEVFMKQSASPKRVFAISAIVGGVAMLIVGGLFVVLASGAQAEVTHIHDATLVSVSDIASGAAASDVKLSAVIDSDAPVAVPGKGEPAIWGRLEINAKVTERNTKGRSKTRHKRIVNKTVQAKTAFLRQAGDSLEVDRVEVDGAALAAATIEVTPTVERPTVGGDRAFGLIRTGADLVYGDVTARIPARYTRGRIEAKTWRLAPGREVFVVGTAVAGNKIGGELFVYVESEEAVVAALESQSGWQLPLGIGLCVLAVVSLAIGAVMLMASKGA